MRQLSANFAPFMEPPRVPEVVHKSQCVFCSGGTQTRIVCQPRTFKARLGGASKGGIVNNCESADSHFRIWLFGTRVSEAYIDTSQFVKYKQKTKSSFMSTKRTQK